MPVCPPPQRILIIRPSALGDVCRTVPVLASLRAAWSDSVIDWVVQDDFVPAVQAHPALNDVLPFARSRLAGWWRSPRRFVDLLRWFGQLRRERYDLVLDCQGLGRSGLMTLATGARRRVGLRSAREFAWLGYNLRVAPQAASDGPLHTVDQMLGLLAPLGVPIVNDMRLYVAQADHDWWIEQRQRMGWPKAASCAVLAPTSRWLSKRWPIERFAQLIEPLRLRGFEKVVIIGSPSEHEQVRDLLEQYPPGEKTGVVDLVGRSTISQTMAVIAGAGLVIANDSAPLHMAVGFDRPCVALFGPTEPAIVGPYGMEDCVVRGFVPQPGETFNFKEARLGDRLMRLISTVAVIQKIDEVLSGRPRRIVRTAALAKPQAAGAAASGAVIEVEARPMSGRVREATS